MKRYDVKNVEAKWQKNWRDSNIYAAVDFDESRPKFVMLTEFPYPSGDGLHLGHVREYTLGDIIARHKRMTGNNVLYPMGYDAFGLPTENYAIKNGIAPQVATERNISNFQKQFDSLGYSIDWSRSFSTTDPSYYKWTQWLFLQFYKKGLAYQDEIAINWCPNCKTGLANEEVQNGRHERCDTLVEKKQLKQWILKITDYADRLINGLSDLDFPSKIADQQINWIGKSKGAEVDFEIENSKNKIRVFTTRPDTIFGATFLVLAPESELVKELTTNDQKDKINSYVKQAQSKSEIERQDTSKEKTGVFTGSYAINPASGEKIPIWTADYVLSGYGTGAIMAVPAHDQRDHDFAEKYNLPVIRVVKNEAPDDQFTADEGIMINSGKYNDMPSSEARERIVSDLEKEAKAHEKVNFKLRDWIFSRQHYWGEPIPIIHCDEHGAVAVPDDQLPVELPKVEKYEPTDNGESPLSEITEWVNTVCPVCDKPAKRETDTMPNWAGSSWYYLRYFDANNDMKFADEEKLKYWGAVDLYLGGMEHTTLHLLYSRFWHEFFYDIGLVPTPEPYLSRRGQGIVLASDGSKMSKSKGNVVNPNTILEQGYGADSIRLAIAFLAPFDQTTPWSPEGVVGTFRFIQRVWTLINEYIDSETEDKVQVDLEKKILAASHSAIKKVSFDLENMNYNTAVSALMEFVNSLYLLKKVDNFADKKSWKFAIESLLKLIAPFAPHLSEEAWSMLGGSESIHISSWPKYEEKYLVTGTVKVVLQVNGKLRDVIEAPLGSSNEEIENLAKNSDKIKSHIEGKEIKKLIVVKDKLVNFVV